MINEIYVDGVKINFTKTSKNIWWQKGLYYLFYTFALCFTKNPASMVAGWWECWMFDYKAWRFLDTYYKNEKKNWVTDEYKIKHHWQLCNIKNIRWEITDIELSLNSKKNTVANFKICLYQGKTLMTTGHFIMVEKEHNYCKM